MTIFSNALWAGAKLSNASPITYSFASNIVVSNSVATNFSDIFNGFSAVTNLEFTKANANLGVVTINYNNSNRSFAYYPPWSDIYLSSAAHFTSNSLRDHSYGTFEFSDAVHEIGHALGLKHVHVNDTWTTETIELISLRSALTFFVGDGTATYSADNLNRSWMTVMSYDYGNHPYFIAPMILDVIALGDIYGVGRHNENNTTYSSEYVQNRYNTVVDTGGIDTVDMSKATTEMFIDLGSSVGASHYVGVVTSQAGWQAMHSSGGNSPDSLLWLYGTFERALGGAKGDTLWGSELDNYLDGQSGNDLIYGYFGADIILGGSGDDTLIGGAGNDTIDGGLGIDTIRLSGNRLDYSFTTSSLVVLVTDNDSNGDGTDNLTNIEFVYFIADSTTLRLEDLIVRPNNLPTGANALITVVEDVTSKVQSTSFKFTDGDKGQMLQKVVITSLPTLGTLKLSGVAVQTNDEISIANINAGNLTYVTASNGSGLGYATMGFKVHDGIAPSVSSYTLTFNATAVNDAPTLANAIADQTATEGNAFSLSVANAFTEVDTGDVLTMSATLSDGKTLPTWLKFNPAMGAFTGTPMDADSSKTINVMVKATDKGKAVVFDTFALVITGVNMAPAAKAITAAASATENLAFTYAIPKGTFTDSDSGDLLTYIASGLPSGLSINTSTGNITGKLNFAGADTPQTVITLTATDRAGLSASTNLTLNVKDVPTITGTSAGDTLVGGAGADVITGGAGSDQLTGGAGADQFKFDQAPGTANLDTITDFLSGTDKLMLSVKNFKAIGTKAGAVTSAQFVQGAGLTNGQDAADRLVFNTSNSTLYYDADGSGTSQSGVSIAVLSGVTSLSVSDLWLF
jgi:Ca2+-binding RTX toxin-like protein